MTGRVWQPWPRPPREIAAPPMPMPPRGHLLQAVHEGRGTFVDTGLGVGLLLPVGSATFAFAFEPRGTVGLMRPEELIGPPLEDAPC